MVFGAQVIGTTRKGVTPQFKDPKTTRKCLTRPENRHLASFEIF